MTVSYTHLDVYKRQIMWCIVCFHRCRRVFQFSVLTRKVLIYVTPVFH